MKLSTILTEISAEYFVNKRNERMNRLLKNQKTIADKIEYAKFKGDNEALKALLQKKKEIDSRIKTFSEFDKIMKSNFR